MVHKTEWNTKWKWICFVLFSFFVELWRKAKTKKSNTQQPHLSIQQQKLSIMDILSYTWIFFSWTERSKKRKIKWNDLFIFVLFLFFFYFCQCKWRMLLLINFLSCVVCDKCLSITVAWIRSPWMGRSSCATCIIISINFIIFFFFRFTIQELAVWRGDSYETLYTVEICEHRHR